MRRRWAAVYRCWRGLFATMMPTMMPEEVKRYRRRKSAERFAAHLNAGEFVDGRWYEARRVGS